MRRLRKIIIHCSDSDVTAHDSIAVIDRWHKERGWKGVGYHYYINKSGKLEYGRHLREAGAHTEGQNVDSIGVCLGGKMKFHPAQFGRLRELVGALKMVFGDMEVYGHSDFSDKTCPNFDFKQILGL